MSHATTGIAALANAARRWLGRRVRLSEATVNKLTLHECEWEYRADPGEEDHGINFTRRYCKCGRTQNLFYHRFGETRHSWRDEPNAEISNSGHKETQ